MKGNPPARSGEHAMHSVSVLGVARNISRSRMNGTEWD
jgi:hypothetical protein